MYAIALHGGAGVISPDIPDAQKQQYVGSLRVALEVGVKILKEGKSSLDAVEAVVRCLEDDPLFNAGKGAVFNRAGFHELEASIMQGNTMRCGAAAGLRTVKNPISLARLVMERSEHVYISGEGAEDFANELGVERVPNEYFSTHKRASQLQDAKRDSVVALDFYNSKQHEGVTSVRDAQEVPYQPSPHGTVGCVAIDMNGQLAAATSTGGLTNKRKGRVGDSPVIGAGTYATSQVAVSATGKGEEFLRHSVSRTIAAAMEYRGDSLQKACDHVIKEKLKPGDGGVIAVDRDGNICMDFNSRGMFRACADSKGRLEVAIWEHNEITSAGSA
jgi:beta-aspartyl-peptidase (threonine type)